MKRIRLKTPERIRLKSTHRVERKSPITKAEKEALRMLEERDDERIEDGRGRPRKQQRRYRRNLQLVLYCLHNDEKTVWLLRAEYTDKKRVPREVYIRDRWAEHL